MSQETIDAPVQDTPQVEAQPAATETTPPQEPFAVDESQFASLSPEQRAALDPVLTNWKTVAKQTLEKERKSFEPTMQRAKALDNLVKDPRFIKWYHEQQNPQRPQQMQPQAPPPVASPEEWANAIQLAASGDPSAINAINQKSFEAWAQPKVQAIEQRQQMIEMQTEMTNLFREHQDAKDLDEIGRENDPTAPSLLEMCLYNVKDRMGGTMEQAYQVAKMVATSMENKSKRAAMGMVQDKKGSITEKPSTTSKDEGVVYVDNIEEAMSQNIEAAMDGRKVRYAVKK